MPRCLRYDMGEDKTTEQGVEYFELQCQYLDVDGKVFGTVVAKLAIEKFRWSQTDPQPERFSAELSSDPREDQGNSCSHWSEIYRPDRVSPPEL